MAPTELPEAGRGRRPVTRGRQVSAARAVVSPAPAATRTGPEARGQQRARTRAQVGEHAPRTGGGGPAREGPCHRPAVWCWTRARSPHTGEARTRCRAVHRPAHRSGPQEPPWAGNEPTASAGPARMQAARGAGHRGSRRALRGKPFREQGPARLQDLALPSRWRDRDLVT